MAVQTGGLLAGEADPVIVVNGEGRSPVLLVCEHAGKVIPASLKHLGLPESELSRHIAWDIGAEPMARRIARHLDAPLILQRYSRLVYDCNRPPESPGAMPEVSETTAIPGNRDLSPEARQARTEALYLPFHAAVKAAIDGKLSRGITPAIVTLHSFTRVFKGVERTVELGLLFDADARLAHLMMDEMGRAHPAVATRLNEPYGPADGVAHTLNLHGNSRGLANVMIEVRNDLIADEKGQEDWAGLLAKLITTALARLGGAEKQSA